jgi:hypothetical protein
MAKPTPIDKGFSKVDSILNPDVDDKIRKLDNDTTLSSIVDALDQVKSSYNDGNSPTDILELSFSLDFKNKSEKVKNAKNKMINFSKLVESNQVVTINELLYSEKNRLQLYDNYNIINNMIAQLPEAIQTYVDNIVSPDDFSKQSININYELAQGKGSYNTKSGVQEFLTSIRNHCDILKKTYNLENRITESIRNCLTYGDHFLAVLKLGEQIENYMLQEHTKPLMSLSEHADKNDYILLDEHTVDINDNEIETLTSMLLEEVDMSIEDLHDTSYSKDIQNQKKEELKNLKSKISPLKIKAELARLVNENVIVNKDNKEILKNRQDFQKDFKNSYYELANSILQPTASKSQSSHPENKKLSKDKGFDNITGSVVKELDRNRTIKLWADGFCYGYYYIDISHKDTLAEFAINANNTRDSLNLFNNNSINQERLMRSKEEFIYSVLVRNIAKKLDKKSILDNLEFKNTIYNVLRQNFIFTKKIQLLYFSNEEVVHFMPNSEETEYGISVYKDILFTAKIYIAVLSSTLMIKIVRSADKRVYYINIGMEKDHEEVINSMMTEIKGRDIRMNDFDDIGRVIRHIGTFDDMWIPTFDGEKPLEVENMEGQNPDIENDFLNYLKKTFVTGMGVPSPYMNDTDDIELAKMISINQIVA